MILTNSNRVLYQLGKGVISRCLLPSLTGESRQDAKSRCGKRNAIWMLRNEQKQVCEMAVVFTNCG